MAEGTASAGEDAASRGVLFIAFGDYYRDEAVFSAQHVKQHTDLPVTLLTDEDVQSAYVDTVDVIEVREKRPKVHNLLCSPYDHTLYLDSDTMVTDDVTDAFDLMDRFDLAAAHDVSRKRSRWSEVMPEYGEVPYAFPEFNSGVIFYRRCPAMDAFADLWAEYYVRYSEGTGEKDQASFRVALWKSDLRIHTLPPEYNVRPMHVREKIEQRRKTVPGEERLMTPRILHWHGVGRTPWHRRLRSKYRPMPY